MNQSIDTSALIQAVLEFAAEHSQEDAYQSVTQLLATRQISLDQWHDTIHALFPYSPTGRCKIDLGKRERERARSANKGAP